MKEKSKGGRKSPSELAAEVLSAAGGFAAGAERETRTQLRDLSRRVARRMELTDAEEFEALQAQVRNLDARLARVEAELGIKAKPMPKAKVKAKGKVKSKGKGKVKAKPKAKAKAKPKAKVKAKAKTKAKAKAKAKTKAKPKGRARVAR